MLSRRTFQSPFSLSCCSSILELKNRSKISTMDSDDSHTPSLKRTKFMVSSYEEEQQQWSHEESTFSTGHSLNPIGELSPLGLKLKKTPSLIELIQFSLSEINNKPASSGGVDENTDQEAAEITEVADSRIGQNSSAQDKRKATNFSALLLRIGTWECVSRYEGDLVVKCYFAKRKLVWEVLEGGLKSKMEIQWSDITALRGNYPKNAPGTLEIQISRPPLFYRESNPQPRKHTLWQATSDFTGGQATIHKRHFLKFSKGILDRHYEKLIQSDSRLNILSKSAFAVTDPPYFDSRTPALKDQTEQSYFRLPENRSRISSHYGYLTGVYDLPSLSAFSNRLQAMVPTLVPEFEHFNPEEILNSSNSVSTSEDSSWSSKGNKLEEIAEYLLNDSLISSEHFNIDRVNSMCSSLQQNVNNGPMEGIWFT